jgi:hypothetical protein
MAMILMLSPEIGKIVEKRHEMILAHEKFGVKIIDIGGGVQKKTTEKKRIIIQVQKQGLRE